MPTTVPMALTRQRVAFQVNRAEMMVVESKAAGMTVANYFQSLAGLPPLSSGRLTRAQMEEEQDRAWEILQSMGINPAPSFPADES